MTSVSKPKIVSLALLLPYEGVDHAGGELLLNHYRVLARHSSRLDAFAIDFDENLPADARDADINAGSYTATIIKMPRWRRTLPGKLLARICRFFIPVLPDIGICAAFSSSTEIRQRIADADLIELQWFEYMYFARLVRRINDRAVLIGYVHDVPSQKFERETSNWPALIRHWYLSYIALLERRVLRGMKKVIVLSDKDANLLTQRSSTVEPIVFNPPLDFGAEAPGFADTPVAHDEWRDAAFGFIAAFHRPENDDGGLWLLSEIWPRVVKSCPRAHLYLVGSKPSNALRAAASIHQNSVTITGYVEDLDAYYSLFSTVIIPLRYGAGVKFKTISGILFGKNVIATPVGIEGTLPEELFFCVSDSADTMANAMIDLIRDPSQGSDIVQHARQEAGTRYSLETYATKLTITYELGGQKDSGGRR